MATITTKDQFDRFYILQIRGICRMYDCGLKHRQINKSRALVLAGEITGKTYKRSEHLQAGEDISEVLNKK